MSQFMGYDNRHSLLAHCRICLAVVQQSSLPVRDETPVLHGAHSKVRNCKQIYPQREKEKE